MSHNFCHCDSTDRRLNANYESNMTGWSDARLLLQHAVSYYPPPLLHLPSPWGRTAPHDRLHSGGRPTKARGSTFQPPLHQPLKNWRHTGVPPMTRITLPTLRMTSLLKALILMTRTAHNICPITSTCCGFSTTWTIRFHVSIPTLKRLWINTRKWLWHPGISIIIEVLFSHTRWHNNAKYFIFITFIASQSYQHV